MLTVDQLRAVALASVAADPGERERALAGIGSPSPEVLGVDAGVHLGDPDRNVRVAALRVLALATGPAAVDGVLRGLDDPVKRVREVAAKCSAPFVDDPRIVARLRQAVQDDDRGSARTALQILGGMYSSPYGLAALEPVPAALQSLAGTPKYRSQVLLSLLRARSLSDETTALLRDFVRDGTKDEAVFATRRLDGFRVAHHGELTDEQRREADRAWGDVWFWVRAA